MALLANKKHKAEECESSLAQAERLMAAKVDVVRGYILAKDRKFDECEKLLMAKGTAESLVLLAQIYLSHGKN
jgi:EAL domain-containing protein (putative c-di-GMP-specific phosphodiesterase class I)